MRTAAPDPDVLRTQMSLPSPTAPGRRHLMCLLLTAVVVLPVRGAVLHVPVEFPDLQSAVEAAADGDEIRVAPGTYTGPRNRSIDFAGKDLDLVSEAGPEATIIDPGGVDQAFYLHSDEPNTSSINGFTIRNGNSMFVLRPGGAIFCSQAATRIRNCIIEDCLGCSSGGGIAYQTSAPTSITDCIIRGCRAVPEGGGLGAGGGLSLSGPIMVRRCTIESNRAIGHPLDRRAIGGGVCCGDGAYLEECLIVGNEAVGWESDDCPGGGVWGSGEFALVRCTIAGNRAAAHGGGVLAAGPGRIEECLVTGNLAGGSGGGAAATAGATVSVLSTTIAGNRSLGGGYVPQPGGGLLALAGAEVTLRRSILRTNCMATGQGDEGFVAAGGSLSCLCSALFPPGLVVEGTLTVTDDCVVTDPRFCAPVSCGQAPSPAGDYALSADSPCLPGNNTCGQRMGARDQGCGPTAIHGTSWSAIKARFGP